MHATLFGCHRSLALRGIFVFGHPASFHRVPFDQRFRA